MPDDNYLIYIEFTRLMSYNFVGCYIFVCCTLYSSSIGSLGSSTYCGKAAEKLLGINECLNIRGHRIMEHLKGRPCLGYPAA
jgi:hypothetical protein